VDITVKGRHTEISERLRQHVADKLAKLERFEHKVTRVDVEICSERNPRQADQRERVELTCHAKGPVIRAEAAAPDVYAALDLATARLEARLQRAADRRRVHHGARTPTSVATATAGLGDMTDMAGPADDDDRVED
jgi:ribosomal subunit interface protein